MVIIYIDFVEVEPLMPHAKFQDHRTFGSGDFFKCFSPYMGILVM